MMENGMIHIYTGDGKGKTTAAVGAAIRGAGAGLKVLFIQLFKDGTSSELNVLRKIGDITVKVCPLEKFTWDMTDNELREYANKALALISENITGGYDLLIIDEFFTLVNTCGLTESSISDIILRRCGELILTGRNAPDGFVSLAHYVSDIRCVKHPFKQGTSARKGIEF